MSEYPKNFKTLIEDTGSVDEIINKSFQLKMIRYGQII